MAEFQYYNEFSTLSAVDLSRHFNSYRVSQAIVDILVRLLKTDMHEYKVLEAGCGTGDKLRSFVEIGARPENCFGLDMSERGIELAKHLSPAVMHYTVGDAFHMPYEDETFDIVFASGLFGCFADNAKVEALGTELRRVMKPNGVLLLCDLNHNFEDFYGTNDAVMAKGLRGYNTENKELEGLLKGKFSVVMSRPIFAIDCYFDASHNPMGLEHFPLIAHQIDNSGMKCAYNFWTFVKL